MRFDNFALRESWPENGECWLATQCCSHQSPLGFPANREFYRENCCLAAQTTNFGTGNCCATVIIWAIP